MLRFIASFFVLLVALLHGGFLYLEMFLWEQETGRTINGLNAEDAATTALLAANQGLYNGFLAAGLLWGALSGKRDVTVFFLLCVIAAGLYGAWSAQSSFILMVQAAPAALALVLTLLTLKKKGAD